MRQETKGIIDGMQRKWALSLPTGEDTVCTHQRFNWKNKRLLCFALFSGLCNYQWCSNTNFSVMDYAFPTSHITIIDYINNGVRVCVLSHFNHM